MPEDLRDLWRKACAFTALRERDTNTLKWILEECWPHFLEDFECETYYLKQNRGTDIRIDECWKMLEESHFEEPTHWRSNNPKRALYDPLWCRSEVRTERQLIDCSNVRRMPVSSFHR